MAEEHKKKGMGPAGAAIAGGIAGAAASLAAVALSDEENRKKIKKGLENVTKRGGKAITDMKKKSSHMAEKMTDKARDEANKALDKAEGRIEDMKAATEPPSSQEKRDLK